VIEVDDLRQMLVHPHAAPGEGAEGLRKQKLGVVNAARLSIAFADDGCDVVIADVLTNETAALHREALGSCALTIVHLSVPQAVAMERAAARLYSLTNEQMQALHQALGAFETFDVAIDTSFTALADSVSKICETLDQRESDR
jgi:Chloramphenicol phosphotransferase-like protein